MMKTSRINVDDNIPDSPSQTFDSLKNRKKIELLQGIDLSRYDEKMIRLLLDGDYKGELTQYKNKVMMLVHEIIDKKIAHTKFGVNTLLYKMVRDAKNDRNASANIKPRAPPKQRKAKQSTATDIKHTTPPPDEALNSPYISTASEEEEEEEEMVEVDTETFVKEVLRLAKTDKKRAMEIIKFNLKPTDDLYRKLMSKLLPKN
jgi:hypothetical protein